MKLHLVFAGILFLAAAIGTAHSAQARGTSLLAHLSRAQVASICTKAERAGDSVVHADTAHGHYSCENLSRNTGVDCDPQANCTGYGGTPAVRSTANDDNPPSGLGSFSGHHFSQGTSNHQPSSSQPNTGVLNTTQNHHASSTPPRMAVQPRHLFNK